MREKLTVTKKDLVVTYFKNSGSGGQKKNKTANCCRIQHPSSGALVQAVESRSQAANRKRALERLTEDLKFQSWAKTQLTRPSDFFIETRVQSPDGKWHWVPSSDSNLAVTEEEIQVNFIGVNS